MSAEGDSEVLEEGEIEDEEDEIQHLDVLKSDGGIPQNHENDANKEHDPKSFTERRSSRHSYGKSPPRQALWESAAVPRPPDQVLLPLTRGGYWAPPPLLPTPSSPTPHSQTPGSRVFLYLRNRTKSADNECKDVENRRPSNENRSTKRKTKNFTKHDIRPKQSDEDSDFENLLRKHKEIQAKLARLSKEEEKSDIDSSLTDTQTPVNQIQRSQLPETGDPEVVVLSDDAVNNSTVSLKSETNGNTDGITDSAQVTANANTEAPDKGLDDDDLHALELRKLALESVVEATAKKTAAVNSTEASETKLSSEKASRTSNDTNTSSKRSRSRSGESKSSKSVKKSEKVSRASGGSSLSKGHTLSHRDRRIFSPSESVDRYGRQRKLRRSLSSHRELERRRREAEDKRRQAEKARFEERRKRFEQKQRETAEKQRQKEEIQEILALKDPAEQIERFLKLVKPQGSNYDRKNKSPAKSSYGRRSSGGRSEKKMPQKMEDNYEEVAMEIDSDSPTLPTLEGFQFEPDDMGFLSTIPQHFQNAVLPGMDLHSLTSFSNVQVLSEWPMKPFDTWVPPLPPEDPPPPPPAESPPPPAPPPPDDPCPDVNSPRPSVDSPRPTDSEEADEESLLREQLLKSLAMKRQKTKPEASESGSPVLQSPRSSPVPTLKAAKASKKVTVKESHRSKHSRTRAFQPPIHKPVVIQLGESSDDSDREEGSQSGPSPVLMLGGIDSFLKQVRKSVDQQKQTERQMGESPVAGSVQTGSVEGVSEEQKLQQSGIKQMEEQLVTLRKDTLREQSVLKMLIEQSNKYQTNQLVAEERLRKIEEQLAAVQKIAQACEHQTQKLRLQVREVRKRVKQKVTSYRQMEEQILTKGQSVFGPKYKLPVQLVNKKAVKRKTNDNDNQKKGQRKVMFKKLKETSSPASPVPKMTPREMVEEKARLQELEQEYAKKIKELKDTQAKQNMTRDRAVGKENENVEANIPRLDKIYLGNTDMNEPSENGESLVKRRLSLQDLKFSTKPLIAQHERGDSSMEAAQPTAKNKGVVFTLPDGQQRQNLKQLEGEKLQKLLQSFAPPIKPNLWNGCLNNAPMPPIEQLSGIDLESKFSSTRKSSVSDIIQVESCPLLYHSPLLHFKSYRLSRYYRTRELLQLSCRTYSNKLDSQRHLCRFELQGTCNDETCPWQHEKDYILSQRELLSDIISYSPKLAGITESTDLEDYKTKIEIYVDKIISQHCDHMNTDQLGVFLVSEVQKSAGLAHPWSVQTAKRVWRPCQIERAIDKTSQQKSDQIKSKESEKIDFTCGLSPVEMDNIISEQDVRYFLDGPGMQEVESTVLQQPTNVQLWISLAYKKLQGPQSDKSETVPLDLCLNVLARALEVNKSSSELWYHYLKIYKHHPDSEDIQELCETALTCAPSYQIFLQYLNLVVSFTEKESICKRLIEYLLTCDENNKDLQSFHCLEAVIYLVNLYIQSGRYKTGLLYLQSLLPGDEKPVSPIQSLLVPLDVSILWLTFISLSQFHQLPVSLIDPANQNPGKIVSRKLFQLPWESHPELSGNVGIILEMLEKAVSVCCPQEASTGEDRRATDLQDEIRIALFMNILTVQQMFVSLVKARTTCRKWIKENPSLPHLWTLASAIEFNTDDIPKAVKVIQDGLTIYPHCAKLYYSLANLYLSQRDSDSALGVLEQCVIALYKVDIADYKTCDPNLLYCKTLNQPVPLNYKAPEFADGVTEVSVEEQIGPLWLNYCLLLELQGDHSQCVESFETALGLFQSSQLSLLWKGYLQFHQRQLSSLPSGQKQKAVSSLTHLLHRCLTSSPVKRDLPCFSPVQWLDYTNHNDMVEVFLRNIPTEDRLVVYKRLVQVMPGNVNLVIRAIEHSLSTEEYMEAQGLCNSVLFEQLANCRLWKLAIGLALKMKNYRQVHKLYKKAVRKLPLMFTLWKDFLLFEVTQGSESGAKWIIEQCQKLGVNIKGFVATVSKLPI